MTLKWEKLDDDLWRTKVEGGWLVKLMGLQSEGGYGGLAFVSDPEHKWRVGTVK